MGIPDAPWISAAENRGTDYMYEFCFGNSDVDYGFDEYDDEPDEEE